MGAINRNAVAFKARITAVNRAQGYIDLDRDLIHAGRCLLPGWTAGGPAVAGREVEPCAAPATARPLRPVCPALTLSSASPSTPTVKAGWIAEVTDYRPGIQNSGVEQLTVQFLNSGTYGAHLTDRGFNGVFLNQARCPCFEAGGEGLAGLRLRAAGARARRCSHAAAGPYGACRCPTAGCAA